MISVRIKQLRKKKHLTQDELAKALDVSRSTISMLESEIDRKPSVDLLEKMSKFFNVSVDFLLTGKEKDNQITISDFQKETLNKKNKTYNEPSEEYSFAMSILRQMVKDGYIDSIEDVTDYQMKVICDALEKDIERMKKEKC